MFKSSYVAGILPRYFGRLIRPRPGRGGALISPAIHILFAFVFDASFYALLLASPHHSVMVSCLQVVFFLWGQFGSHALALIISSLPASNNPQRTSPSYTRACRGHRDPFLCLFVCRKSLIKSPKLQLRFASLGHPRLICVILL